MYTPRTMCSFHFTEAESGECMREWLSGMWDQKSGRSIKLGEAEIIKMGLLSETLDSVFFSPEGLGRAAWLPDWNMDQGARVAEGLGVRGGECAKIRILGA